MKEIMLKYGCNPNQKPARIFMEDGGDLPVEVLCGRVQFVATRERDKTGDGALRGYIFQARFSDFGVGGKETARKTEKSLFRGRYRRA